MSLFDLETRDGRWQSARDTLGQGAEGPHHRGAGPPGIIAG